MRGPWCEKETSFYPKEANRKTGLSGNTSHQYMTSSEFMQALTALWTLPWGQSHEATSELQQCYMSIQICFSLSSNPLILFLLLFACWFDSVPAPFGPEKHLIVSLLGPTHFSTRPAHTSAPTPTYWWPNHHSLRLVQRLCGPLRLGRLEWKVWEFTRGALPSGIPVLPAWHPASLLPLLFCTPTPQYFLSPQIIESQYLLPGDLDLLSMLASSSSVSVSVTTTLSTHPKSHHFLTFSSSHDPVSPHSLCLA